MLEQELSGMGCIGNFMSPREETRAEEGLRFIFRIRLCYGVLMGMFLVI